MQAGNQPYQQGNINKPRRKLGCAFALLPISAIILLGVSIWYSYTSYMFYSNGVEVQGTVVRLESSHSADRAQPTHLFLVTQWMASNMNMKVSTHPIHPVTKLVILRRFWLTRTTRARRVKIVFGNSGFYHASCAPFPLL